MTAALTQQARQRGLTLNTVMQAAWGILLGRLTGRSDVVFGVTVAGRPPEIAGIERMVGLFINTLPLRLRLDPAQPLLTLLSELQDAQSRLIAHQHLGLAEIQGLAGVGELFDTLVVFENYPVDHGGLAAEVGGLRLTHVSGHDAAHYPMSLGAMPGEQLRLRLDYRRRSVRPGKRAGAGGAAGTAAGGGDDGARARDRSARHSECRGARHHPAGMERDRACGRARDAG